MSSLELLSAGFGFRDFLGSIEGSIWQVIRPATPFLVSPDGSACIACRPAWILEPGDQRQASSALAARREERIGQ
ncbi:MAG TPA: hypothetical protein VFF19_13900, partial [Reyranella sp.]|nr:hypothetical protein [Reyranella sp.]